MTSSRVILPAVSGRLKEYELRAILIFVPGIRFGSPTARAGLGPSDNAEIAAMPMDRVRNRRRWMSLFMVVSNELQYILSFRKPVDSSRQIGFGYEILEGLTAHGKSLAG